MLGNIEDYLLNELNIMLPQKDNSLGNRIFSTTLSTIGGNRYDCDYYSKSYFDLEEMIERSIYPIDKLDKFVIIIRGGKTPASSDYCDEKTKYPIIKVGSYTNDLIDLNKVDYTLTSNDFEVHKNDIFILSAAHQAEYVGRHIKFLEEEPTMPRSYVGELICIRVDSLKCNPMYLFSLLSTEIYKGLINREKTGQTAHIYGKDIKHIKVPIPPIQKQNEIAEHIYRIREKATKLQQESLEYFEHTRKKIEELILMESHEIDRSTDLMIQYKN